MAQDAGPAGETEDQRLRLPALKRPSLNRPSLKGHLHLPGPVAALATGAVVGVALVAMTSATLSVCTSVRGTSSCGMAGLVPLLVITVAAVVLGSVLLRVLGVATPTSTSLLAMALLVVLVLLALLPALDQRWAAYAVPVLAMLTYVGSWWLTTNYTEPAARPR
jgi:hypothetical protein